MSRTFVIAVLIASAVTAMVVTGFAALDINGGLKVGALVGFLVGLLFLLPRTLSRACVRCGFNLTGTAVNACPRCGLATDDHREQLPPNNKPGMNQCIICGAELAATNPVVGCPACDAVLKRMGTSVANSRTFCPRCYAECDANADGLCDQCGAELLTSSNDDG